MWLAGFLFVINWLIFVKIFSKSFILLESEVSHSVITLTLLPITIDVVNEGLEKYKYFSTGFYSIISNLFNITCKGGTPMIVTTTQTVEGRQIAEYKGIVFGEVVSGVNFVKDLFSGITDIFGGRSSTYENELQEAREKAIDEMCKRAERLGANAVVGVDVDYEVLGKENGMLMVSVSGTAVKLK